MAMKTTTIILFIFYTVVTLCIAATPSSSINPIILLSAVSLKPPVAEHYNVAIEIRKNVGKQQIVRNPPVQIVRNSPVQRTNIDTLRAEPSLQKRKAKAHSSVIMVRGLLFLFYCTLGSAMPFIPLYYRQLGIPADQIGLLGAITPAITFVVSPLWGALADTTGKHQLIMICTFIGSIIARCALICRTRNVFIISLLVASSAILNAPVKPLMDSAVMSMITDKSEYGKSRLFGQLGFGFGSYLVGPLLGKRLHLMFIVHALLALPTTAVMCLFTPKPQEKQKSNVLAGLRLALRDPKILVFFSIVCVIGLSSGVSENFAYVRLGEVGGAGNVMGICRMVSSLAGCPFFWLSGQILTAVGVNGVLAVTLLSYIIRLIIYASIRNPWQALPAEILRGSVFATFWAGSTYYVYQASPRGLTATMLGLLNAVYGGIGQSLGSLIGGALCKQMGISKAFYYWAGVDTIFLILFGLYRTLFAK
mmetsp:Transcript_18947/g.19065  ORF Transcript_18947/g.19065 Transcript_18947/m.19065 type:complete len:477 (+) Transcript_18947:165-1595(+)